MVGKQIVPDMVAWLFASRTFFLAIHLSGVLCFVYVLVRRMIPLFRGERDLRFDQPWQRVGEVAKFWLGQWKQPRYLLAGLLHICLFAGFLVLLVHTFSMVMLSTYPSFVIPGFSGRGGEIYNLLKDYVATVVFLSAVIAAIRRIVFKPARYAVPAVFWAVGRPGTLWITKLDA